MFLFYTAATLAQGSFRSIIGARRAAKLTLFSQHVTSMSLVIVLSMVTILAALFLAVTLTHDHARRDGDLARSIPVPLAWLGVVSSILIVVGTPLEFRGFIKERWFLWMPILPFELALAFWLLIKAAPNQAMHRTANPTLAPAPSPTSPSLLK
jgi:cytochrome bd-type quinol oxidase subunit 2